MEVIKLLVGGDVPTMFQVQKGMQGYRMEMDEDFNIHLLVMMPNISAKELKDYIHGDKKFFLCFASDILFMGTEFGKSGIMEAPFHASLYPYQIKLPDLNPPGSRLFVHIIIADSQTLKIKALSGCTLSPEFSKVFVSAVDRQIRYPISRHLYLAQVEVVYKYFDVPGLIKNFVITTCFGGS